jgi:deoxycytidine triphosphate deaminase
LKRNSTYIMNKIKDPLSIAKPAQVGVDLTVKDIKHITTGYNPKLENTDECAKKIAGYLDSSGKMHVSPGTYFDLPKFQRGDKWVWKLFPGTYAVEFDQGISMLNPDENAYIIQRSSLNRVGTRIEGSIFDPGFETDNLGATMFVFQTIYIEEHARVAQLTIETNEPTDNMYNGTWQGKANA